MTWPRFKWPEPAGQTVGQRLAAPELVANRRRGGRFKRPPFWKAADCAPSWTLHTNFPFYVNVTMGGFCLPPRSTSVGRALAVGKLPAVICCDRSIGLWSDFQFRTCGSVSTGRHWVAPLPVAFTQRCSSWTNETNAAELAPYLWCQSRGLCP